MSAEETRSVLVVDDDEVFRTRLVRAFAERGLDARGADAPRQPWSSASADSPELAVVDLRMPDRSGLELVRELKAIDPATSVVVLTGYGSIATALEAVRLGATHYLTKPADADEILSAFDRPSRLSIRPGRRSSRDAFARPRGMGAYPACVDRLQRQPLPGCAALEGAPA